MKMVSPIAALTTSPNLSPKYPMRKNRKCRAVGLTINLLQSPGGFLINYKPREPCEDHRRYVIHVLHPGIKESYSHETRRKVCTLLHFSMDF